MAGLLKNASSDVRLAKVDAVEEKELANEFGVGGFPTLKFFKDGNRQNVTDFSGNVFICISVFVFSFDTVCRSL